MTFFKKSTIWILCLFVFCQCSSTKDLTTIKTEDYYPIANGNEWRYTAPVNWKDGDYISKIVLDENRFQELLTQRKDLVSDSILKEIVEIKSGKTFRHYDATKSAKLLIENKKGIYYIGETFSGDESFVLFDQPILWFSSNIEFQKNMDETRDFTRIYKDGRIARGVFLIIQSIPKKETITVTAGTYQDCLRVEFNTFWNFGDGSEAHSLNVYHHAKNVGVVNASARFILLQNGKELLNRLVETDLKSYQLF